MDNQRVYENLLHFIVVDGFTFGWTRVTPYFQANRTIRAAKRFHFARGGSNSHNGDANEFFKSQRPARQFCKV